jgi:ribosomal-protein-alanine N-acetyltransferase
MSARQLDLGTEQAFTIRPMAEADLAAVMAVETAGYEFPWTEAILRDCLRVGYSCWVLVTADGMSGHAVMSLMAPGECHVLNVCVRPDLQGRGLGRELMAHLIATARGHGATLLLLEVRPSNQPALALYRSLGFNELGLRRDYYPARHGREDGLVLALELLQ